MNKFPPFFHKVFSALFLTAVLFVGTNCFAGSAKSNNIISIKEMNYSPEKLTIPVGTTVTWTNQDIVPHTVTSPGKKRILNSAKLSQGESYTYIFNKAGIYNYFCKLHPAMNGRIIVKASTKK